MGARGRFNESGWPSGGTEGAAAWLFVFGKTKWGGKSVSSHCLHPPLHGYVLPIAWFFVTIANVVTRGFKNGDPSCPEWVLVDFFG